MSGQTITADEIGLVFHLAGRVREKAESIQESSQKFLQNPQIKEIRERCGSETAEYISKCNDRDTIIRTYEETKKRAAEQKSFAEPIEKRIGMFGVPTRFKSAKKELISPSVWRTVYPVEDGLFLFGGSGSGKTFTAVSIMKEIMATTRGVISFDSQYHKWRIERPLSPEFVSVPDLLLEIRDTFSGTPAKTESQIINSYTGKRLVIFDDLGAEKTTDWSIQTLYTIIDRRYRDRMPTIITSNLDLDAISEKLSDRIASRIAGMCKVVEVVGNDRRIEK